MGFRAITAAFQAQIEEHQDRKVDQDLLEDVEEILEEYCIALEEQYGIGLKFDLDINEDDGRLKYSVVPATELDGMLLTQIAENEAFVPRASFRIQ